MLNLTNYLPKLKEFEGSIPYLYLDTKGYVTVGVGSMLPDAAAAQKLAFVRRPDATAKPPVLAGDATAEEIKADFDNVKKQTPAKSAGYYKQFTKLDLPDAVIDSLLNAQVQSFKTELCAIFPDFDNFSEEACAAVFDMAYNAGIAKLQLLWPSFCKAVKEKDWAVAAKESNRTSAQPSRNDWTKAQLEKAAADAKAAAAASPKNKS